MINLFFLKSTMNRRFGNTESVRNNICIIGKAVFILAHVVDKSEMRHVSVEELR